MENLKTLYYVLGRLEALKIDNISSKDIESILVQIKSLDFVVTEDLEFEEDSRYDSWEAPEADYRRDFNRRVNWDLDLDQQGDIW